MRAGGGDEGGVGSHQLRADRRIEGHGHAVADHQHRGRARLADDVWIPGNAVGHLAGAVRRARPQRRARVLGERQVLERHLSPGNAVERHRDKTKDAEHGHRRHADSDDAPRRETEPRGLFDELVGQPREDEAGGDHDVDQVRRRKGTAGDPGEGQQRPVPEIERVGNLSDEDHRRAGQYPAAEHRVGTARDHERGAGDRQRGPPARKSPQLRGGRHAQDHRQAGATADFLPAGRQSQRHVRHQNAHGQFPETRPRLVVGETGRGGGHVQRQTHDPDGERYEEERPPAPSSQHREDRPHEIELLLDTERPQVQQRLAVALAVEIADLAHRREIGHEQRRRESVPAEQAELLREHRVPADDEDEGHDDDQRGKQAPHATGIEAREAEGAGGEFGADQAADQIARDDEEDVDADIARAQRLGERVIEHDRQDRDGPQAVDVGPIGCMDAGCRCRL